MRRALLLVALCAGAFVLAPTASAAMSWGGGPADLEGSAANGGACGDPCVHVWVERYGNGRVLSNFPNTMDQIDCGTACTQTFNGFEDDVRITPVAGAFIGWNGCPRVAGNGACIVSLGSGEIHCLRAYFGSAGEPLMAGACPPPGAPPPPPPPQTPPPVSGTCSNPNYTNGPDVIYGVPTLENEILCGGGGNDVIYGRGGDDLLRGGPGNDRLYGGPGNDKLYGDQIERGRTARRAGNDRLYGGAGRDRLYGEGGADRLDGGSGVDIFAAGLGTDVLLARDRNRELVNGNGGRDRARVDRNDVRRSIERRF